MNAPLRPCKQVIIGNPALEPEDDMQFRLTYEGPLSSATRGLADHKHEIRKKFHRQLKRVWNYHPAFKDQRAWVYEGEPRGLVDGKFPEFRKDQLGSMFSRCGYKFVPVVCADLRVHCSLNILFLRPDPPGEVWNSGDIDNRIKTLIDALKMPGSTQDLGKQLTPGDGEDLFFVLLEDDKLISRLTVETDMLLEPTGPSAGKQDARLVITVGITPYVGTMANLALA